jgi:acetylornithine deacetylase/succinyl-diaminopimelate desuccinylase-like protein
VAVFTITAHGLPAHAGVEHHLGRSAIREISHQILALEAMTDYARELTVNVGLPPSRLMCECPAQPLERRLCSAYAP